MVEFLSPEWITRLDRAVRSDAALERATAEISLVVEQQITRPDGPATVYRVVFDRGSNRVEAGTGEATDVRFTQDIATATAIARGELSAQRAFMTGELTVGGNLTTLVDHRAALGGLTDLFSALRAEKTFPQGFDAPDMANEA